MRNRWCSIALAGALALAACSSSGGGAGEPDASPDDGTGDRGARPALTVGPPEGLADEPIEVSVAGVDRATVVLTATDDTGREWRGEQVVAGEAVLSLPAVLDPEDGKDGLFVWSLDAITVTVSLQVPGGTELTSEVERRIVAPGIDPVETDPATDGFVGTYWAPAAPRDAGPAVVLLGGSNGGPGGLFEAPLLASRQVPALQVALSGVPGTPDELADVALETVEAAIGWLAVQPGVDPERIWLLGASRGSEAALLVASAHPELVAGVAAVAPSNVALCRPGCGGAAWTRAGVAVPYTEQLNEPAPTDVPEAVIPVERIDGPVITTCGGDDATWHACAYAEAIAGRRGDRADDVAASDPSAGHGVASLAPGTVIDPATSRAERAADDRVRTVGWAALLDQVDAVFV